MHHLQNILSKAEMIQKVILDYLLKRGEMCPSSQLHCKIKGHQGEAKTKLNIHYLISIYDFNCVIVDTNAKKQVVLSDI